VSHRTVFPVCLKDAYGHHAIDVNVEKFAPKVLGIVDQFLASVRLASGQWDGKHDPTSSVSALAIFEQSASAELAALSFCDGCLRGPLDWEWSAGLYGNFSQFPLQDAPLLQLLSKDVVSYLSCVRRKFWAFSGL